MIESLTQGFEYSFVKKKLTSPETGQASEESRLNWDRSHKREYQNTISASFMIFLSLYNAKKV